MKTIILTLLVTLSLACESGGERPTPKFKAGDVVKIRGLDTKAVVEYAFCDTNFGCRYSIVSSTANGITKETISENLLEN